MANFTISSLTAGTPDGATTKIEASILNNGSYESASVTPNDIVGSAIVELTDTLEAGETTIIFQDAAITNDANLEFFTNRFGVNPTNVQVITGVVTLTFAAMESDLGVKVRII